MGSNFDQDVTKIDFENVYVTQLTDDSDVINAKLAQGLDVIISPGIYYLKTSLRVTRSDQVILGTFIHVYKHTLSPLKHSRHTKNHQQDLEWQLL
jgi:hypothetical protein